MVSTKLPRCISPSFLREWGGFATIKLFDARSSALSILTGIIGPNIVV